MKSTSTGGRDHAIVMGGSRAGLLAARVLSDYYREVTVIERDILPSVVEQRRGVPQGRRTMACRRPPALRSAFAFPSRLKTMTK